MIAKVAPKRRSGRGSFMDLRAYLERDDAGQERDDLVATWSENVASHETADLEMERLARDSRVDDPVYHVILSWRPHEHVGVDVARGAIDATLRSLGIEDHQWFAALHRDDSDGRTHLHLAVNRINPITLVAFDRWKEHTKLARAAEWVEREYGCLVDRRMSWRAQIPEIDLGLSLADAESFVERQLPEGVSVAPTGAAQREMDGAHRAGYSWVALLKRDAVPAALAAAQRPGASWADVHAALETYGVRCTRAGSGLRILGNEIGQHIKGSRVGFLFGELTEKLGEYVPNSTDAMNKDARLIEAREMLKNATSWNELHENLAGLNLLVESRGRGGRLFDLDAGETATGLGSLGLSMPQLEERLGKFQRSELHEGRQEREQQRVSAGVADRLTAICESPEIVLERLRAHHAVWSNLDVEAELARIIGMPRDQLVSEYVDGVREVIDRVTAISCILGDVPGKTTAPLTWMTTKEIVAEEREALAAFSDLAGTKRDIALRDPSDELDTQQRAAYMHLSDGNQNLRIVTGIGGAGKSRLLRDLCAAHREHGDTVVGTAVAGSAALVLGHEAEIPAQTVAKLLYDLEQGHQILKSNTVVIVDEASMLGTADAGTLARHVKAANARLYLVGDVQQHEAVARGPLLSELVDHHGAADLSMTRRAQEQWLRDVGVDLRAGRVARALDQLRERGCVAEYDTTEKAMTPLIEGYANDVRSGRLALLIATTRADVAKLNRLAREALRDMLGDESEYLTAFGKRAFAIGDHVVTREAYRATGAVNGDTWVIIAHHAENTLELCRDRDGARVLWDLRERPAIDYGHAITSYRSQGRTVDASYVLVTQADAQRGLYVDITRARSSVLIAYGRDEVADFGRLLDIGARERLKHTVASLERYLEGRLAASDDAVQSSAQRTLTVTALLWELKAIHSGETPGFKDEERKVAGQLIAGLEKLKSNHRLSVERDLHRQLKSLDGLRAQMAAAPSRFAQQLQERERKQSRERGIDR